MRPLLIFYVAGMREHIACYSPHGTVDVAIIYVSFRQFSFCKTLFKPKGRNGRCLQLCHAFVLFRYFVFCKTLFKPKGNNDQCLHLVYVVYRILRLAKLQMLAKTMQQGKGCAAKQRLQLSKGCAAKQRLCKVSVIQLSMSRFGLAVRCLAGNQKDLGSPFFSKVVVYGHCLRDFRLHN